ncbi:hypothetical protein L7F22_021274 [Adiantum nelumboides]|nr:hypothetical protein [Adiantum nelumboides]
MDVVPEPSSSKTTVVIGERKKKAPKVQEPSSSKTVHGLKIAMPASQDAPQSTDVPREPCKGATSKKAPKAPKVPEEAQLTKQGLKIAMPADQDAPLSADVPREPCQGSSALKTPKSGQSKEVSGTVGRGSKGSKGGPMNKTCRTMARSSPLKAQKSGQAKEVTGKAGSKPPKTQVNKRNAKTDVKEKEGTAVPKQHNVKTFKKMKEVGIREVAFEQKLAIAEVKVKGHTGKGQLEKVPEDKIALKRDGMRKKAKKHVEKELEDKGPADKSLALVCPSKRPKLQTLKTSNEKPYVEVINGGKLVRICRVEPPCASCNTLMEKRSRMMQHLKKVHALDVFIPQRLGGQPQGSLNSDVPKSSIRDQRQIKVGMLTTEGDEDKNSRGSDDGGDEDDRSSQDGGGDDDSDNGSNDDADDDDGGSDVSGGDDDKADGENDGTDDEDGGSGSDEEDSEV